MNESSPLKIVYLIARFHPFKGGAEQNCYQLATRMAAAGHSVTVFTTDVSPDDTALPPEEIIEGVKVIRCHNVTGQLSLGFYPSLLPQLLSTPADIIHSENGPGIVWHEFCLWCKKLTSPGTKFIVTPHGPFLATPGTHSGIKYVLAMTGKILMWPYLRLFWTNLFDLFIQVNPHQQQWLRQEYGVNPNKIALLPNAIDPSMLVDEKYFDPTYEHKVVITYVGRFEKYKGIQNVMLALSKLISTGKIQPETVKFRVLGRGAYYPDLQLIRSEYHLDNVVEFVLNPSDSHRDQILEHSSQIHILPSSREATGIALLEAMAKGNALITTHQNEAAEMIITEGENGFIYDWEDIERLCEILLALIADASLRQKMIAANILKARSMTWEQIFPAYVDMVESLVTRH